MAKTDSNYHPPGDSRKPCGGGKPPLSYPQHMTTDESHLLPSFLLLPSLPPFPLSSQEQDIIIDCPIEPAFLALGPFHLAVGMNNRAWICELANQGICSDGDGQCGNVYMSATFSKTHTY